VRVTRPNFIVIGAARSGTTSFFEYLRLHPEIYMAPAKELIFFWERWHLGIDWYESQFAGAGDAKAIGEASPGYTIYPARRGVAERIARTLPDVKLIYLMRDPVARIHSNYKFRYALATENRPINEALVSDPTYMWMSSYALQINEYLRFFDRSRILLLLNEDLRDRREATLQKTFSFLGVDDTWEPPNIATEYNPPRPMRPRPAFRLLGDAIIRTRLLFGWEYAPAQLPERLRPYISKPIDPALMRMSDDLRRAMSDVLRADVAKLAELMPPGFDGWGLL
jgi:hypothetical protein